ncbi:MAG: PHP domain-containing protein [Desulfovibrionaceae bacterium]
MRMLIDLHVHSTYSPCSRLTVGEILAHARQRGLDGVCLTDHDTMAVAAQVREGVQADGLCVIVGMEYATPQGDYLVFGPFEALAPGLHARGLLELVRDGGGVAVAAHPFRSWRPVRPDCLNSGLCTHIETMNGRNEACENQQARDWAMRHDMHATGGSDAHALDELGRCATRFDAPVRSRAEFVAALRAGTCSPVRDLPSFI